MGGNLLMLWLLGFLIGIFHLLPYFHVGGLAQELACVDWRWLVDRPSYPEL